MKEEKWYVVYSVAGYEGRYAQGPYSPGQELEYQVEDIRGFAGVYHVQWCPEGSPLLEGVRNL